MRIVRKKNISKVMTSSGEYYVYDLTNEFGKIKRLYGKSENEIIEKLKELDTHSFGSDSISFKKFKAKANKLHEYCMEYTKMSVDSIPVKTIKRILLLINNVIQNSALDKDISEIEKDDIVSFFDDISGKYYLDDVNILYIILESVFRAANNDGITNIDFPEIELADKKTSKNKSFFLSPENFELLKKFCIEDDCKNYGKNEQVILMSMFMIMPISDLKNVKIKDVNVEDKTILIKGKTYIMSDECAEWITRQARHGRLAAMDNSGMIQPAAEPDSENEDISISRYTYEPDGLFLVNSNNSFPTAQSLNYTLQRLSLKHGFPKGLTTVTLFKSAVVSELEKGVSINELSDRLGYASNQQISLIQDEYEIKKMLFG